MTVNNTTSPVLVYAVDNSITSTDAFVTYYAPSDPTIYDFDFPIQKRWFNYVGVREWILQSTSNVSGFTTAVWTQLNSGASLNLNFPVPHGTSPVVPSGSGTITLTSSDGSITITGGTNLIDLKNTASIELETITGDDNTVVTPIAGNIGLQGLVVANSTHSKAVFTASTTPHVELVEVQLSAAIASTDISKVGLSAYNTNQFVVDANGFVSIIGGSTPPTLGLIPQSHTAPGTSPVIPDGSGNITLSAFIVNAGGVPIQTVSTAANALGIDVQLASSVGSSSATNAGLSSFDSGSFAVDANGFTTSTLGTALSWTPTLSGSTGDGATTYTVQAAKYTKINDMVVVQGQITWIATTATGNIQIKGLPATFSFALSQYVGTAALANIAFPGGALYAVITGVNNSRTALIECVQSNGTFLGVPMSATGNIAFTLTYFGTIP